jgi:hypothetical protein
MCAATPLRRKSGKKKQNGATSKALRHARFMERLGHLPKQQQISEAAVLPRKLANTCASMQVKMHNRRLDKCKYDKMHTRRVSKKNPALAHVHPVPTLKPTTSSATPCLQASWIVTA